MELKVYKGLTYLLALPNAFIGLITIFGVLASLFNPVLLLAMGIFVGTVLYSIYSFIFLQKGIVEGRKCSFKLKRRLRTTSILTILFCVMNLTNCIGLMVNKTSIDIMVDRLFTENKDLNNSGFSPEILTKILTGTIYFMGVYAALLLLHTLMTYKFTKLYADVFVDAAKQY